jgi:hypothetical protein
LTLTERKLSLKDSPTDAPVEELPHSRQDAVRHYGRPALAHLIEQRDHIAFSHIVNRPSAPNGENLAMQDADRFARGPVLRDVAAYEFSHQIRHLIGVEAAP